MDINKFVQDIQNKVKNAKLHFVEELKKIRTGRANPAMLDGVVVEVYSTQLPLKQLASITAPEAQLLQITPFDPSNLNAISESIRNNQSLDLNPMDDGRVVRVPIPPLTTERREQLVKQLSEKVEETMISARNIRHEGLNAAKNAKNNGEISEDDYKRIEKQVDDAIQTIKLEIDSMMHIKGKEIMTV